ncbi:MAG: hypothetical protein J5I52_09405 [Saprospiraceae bacterium]|nr:MAG: quinol:cytochrome c oxidoreductase quinone-binding subunit 2 [Bacteroidetes bacterium OLB9]MCO6464353.1 hypothetical protein [Saprospiraceae bacterium]
MNQYSMTSSQRNFLFGAMGIGVICMILTWMIDDELHTRFWSNLLLNSTFFTLISVMALFFMAASITAYAGWYVTFKRIIEAFSLFMVVGLVLLIIIGLGNYFHWHHLYHWTDTADVATDQVLLGKSSFLNANWYMFGTIIFGGAWAYLAYKIRDLSVSEDDDGADVDRTFKYHNKIRVYAAILLPLIGFASAAMIWQWIMSVDAHWYSTMFAWYTSASAFVAMLALAILLVIFLKSRGYFELVNENHIHDLGKYLFAFSIFWTYLWFSQFMLIWYANIGEETIYFKERYNNYATLFFANIAINFLVPFIILMRNDTKRKVGTMTFVAIVVLLGHWLDFFLMIKPGTLITANHAMGVETEAVQGFVSGFTVPSLLDLGTFIGFLGLFVYVSLWIMSKAALTPKNDPYLEESVHHHVV